VKGSIEDNESEVYDYLNESFIDSDFDFSIMKSSLNKNSPFVRGLLKNGPTIPESNANGLKINNAPSKFKPTKKKSFIERKLSVSKNIYMMSHAKLFNELVP
jgi:hypothetical protein